MTASQATPERVLITGAVGFLGRHLARRLAGEETQVVGLGRTKPGDRTAELAEFVVCDLTDHAAVGRVIEALRPTTVYHLAGLTSNQASAGELQAANVDGLRNLIDACRTTAARADRTMRMLVVGSAAELGSAGATPLPVRETARCEPETDYGRSKLAATRLALAEPTDGPLKIVVARTFNLIGPGLGSGLSLGRFAEQIAAVLRGESKSIECGNLTTRRDYLDVRDAVALYVRLLRFGTAGELYNVCRGRSHSIRELLQAMIERTRRSIVITENCAPPREGDLADIYGDMTKTIGCCGPMTVTPIERSLADLLDAAVTRDASRRRAA